MYMYPFGFQRYATLRASKRLILSQLHYLGFMEVIPIPIASAAHLVTAFEAEAKKEKLAFEKLQEPVSG